MSRLSSSGVDEVLKNSLEPWLNNVPDYYDVEKIYRQQGKLNSEIRKLKREIERKEEAIIVDIDKPRSNDARKAKLAATVELKDRLVGIESQLAIVDAEAKLIEIKIKMFNAANYRTKVAYDIG